MFNAPRPSQRYGGSSSNGFGSNSLTDSFAASDPLANSAYDGLDPWSSTPSPVPPPPAATPPSGFASVIADATVPQIYRSAFNVVDPSNTGETSVNALSRVLGTSNLPASTIDRIVSLVTSSRSRVTKLEFFVALALVALAQSGKDLSIEQVASLASANSLPEPTLALAALPPSYSGMSVPIVGNQSSPNYVRPPAPAYSSDDPWAPYGANTPGFSGSGGGAGAFSIGAPSGVSGTGLPRDWWKRQEKVSVTALGQQGFILNRYMVYEISSERGAAVSRRYSEFVFLWDCLVRRYPFRIFPQLPPKRVGADDNFIEQRKKGLARFLNYVVNHPVIKEDGVLSVFLSEPSLENWRKHASISLEEESASKHIDSVEEMSIPRDLEEKLGIMRSKIGSLIEQWQKICILAERLMRRREAAAVRNPNALFKRSFISAYFTPSVSISSSTSSLPPSAPSSPTRAHSIDSADRYSTHSNPISHSTPTLGGLASSIARLHLPSSPFVGSARPDGSADGGFYTSHWTDPQADLSRLTLTVNVLNEVNEICWRGDDCELCEGVRNGFGQVSAHLQRHADEIDTRAKQMLSTTLESFKTQRDLYIAVRDLFIRHDRLSGDQVERLKKRVEVNGIKMEGIRAAQKEGWQSECEKLQSMVERDQAAITAQLNRRVFVRHCMWHELRVVLHNRENALITQAVKHFAGQESVYAEAIANNWQSLNDAVENMPYE